ncbi:hypothetical protein JRO89_XS03G0079500 [Xanthoceras sorbifolium]|uniref:KIB1-4 beta-propeller domain-containing protein n=1 Tax=Xanthoceras sorbifolium TaxID=99658 RepID=A0ABQ8I934_9ROSI|nr:hypothetical protein JRO89_XS03G0079500 [Xanthoceras sorbifolium]
MAKCNKRMRKSSSSKWGELHSNILDIIFQSLSFKDVLRVQSVSSHWFSVSKALIASKSHLQSNNQIPWLMLPPGEQEEKQQHTNGGFRFINLEHKRVHHDIDNDILREIMAADSCCVGSSHGWLIFLDQKASPFLLNAFIQVKIHLPCLYSLLGILKIEKNIELDEYCIVYNNNPKNKVSYTTHLREKIIHKGVLSSNPCLGVNNLGVVVIYGSTRKLGYCNYGDGHHDSSWSGLDGKFWPYHDIVCYKNKLYALGENACVETWDLDGCVPIKRMEIGLCFPTKSTKMLSDFRYLYACRFYLVENLGDWLLVVRYIGEFVNGNNVVVREEDLLTDEDTHPLVCPYRTLLFHFYKLDFDEKRWIEVESLGDSALFLGGSDSISVSSSSLSGYKKNSIYFTDDYWDRMEEDYLYGGHDMGVFSMEEQMVEPIYQSGSMKIQPPPCWVAPSFW